MNPEHDFITVPQELDEDKGLLELHALLSQSGEQQLPETVELLQTAADGVRGKVASADHLTARVVQDDDGIAVSGHLSFESLMLLDLGLVINKSSLLYVTSQSWLILQSP